MALVPLIEFLKKELEYIKGIEVPVNGDIVNLPGSEAYKRSVVEEFSSKYNRFKELLAKNDRKYGISLVEDAIKIQRGIIDIYSYAETEGIQPYVSKKLSEASALVEKRKKEDHDVMFNCFASDDLESNIQSAKRMNLSNQEIKERCRLFRTVGYLWEFFDELSN